MPAKIKKHVRLHRKNFERAVSTDTFPEETPIIFSNDGFYAHCMTRKTADPIDQFLFSKLIDVNKSRYTKPYKYRIRKAAAAYRTLSLLHPLAQWNIANFYRLHEEQICYFCSRSRFSLRAPTAVASSVYVEKNEHSNLGDQRATTYFAYEGVSRLYRFFNSAEFCDLEAKFPILVKLDVNKCFDSIYTHTIPWVVRSKPYSKENTSIKSFGNDFDKVMQKSNYNETNGIPIGPESSRVFAEVILQDVDCCTEAALLPHLKYGDQFVVKRYVDDIFIFAADKKISARVGEVYADHLSRYNLSINAAKTECFERPFFTKKSRLIRHLNLHINKFVDSFTRSPFDKAKLLPKEIYSRPRLVRSFVDAIKSSCSEIEVGYDEAAPYIVSALHERAKRVARSTPEDVVNHQGAYFDSLMALLESSLFFYNVAPGVSASYKLCQTVIIISRFVSERLPDELPTVAQAMHQTCASLLSKEWSSAEHDVGSFVFLEAMNVVLGASDLGADFSFNSDHLRSIFKVGKKMEYFQIISLLFYCRDIEGYADLRKELIDIIDARLHVTAEILQDSELAHLFLDACTCPYISIKKRSKWIASFYRASLEAPPPKVEMDAYVERAAERPWFVDWNQVDILELLARKKLKQAYA